jgi:hypothetical protein
MSTTEKTVITEGSTYLDPDELAAARTLRRRARTAAGLTTLYAARADLDGVSPAAQMYAESVRWTA